MIRWILCLSFLLSHQEKQKKTWQVTVHGKQTIQELIDIINTDPRRGYGHEKVLTSIKVDGFTMDMLNKKDYQNTLALVRETLKNIDHSVLAR